MEKPRKALNLATATKEELREEIIRIQILYGKDMAKMHARAVKAEQQLWNR